MVFMYTKVYHSDIYWKLEKHPKVYIGSEKGNIIDGWMDVRVTRSRRHIATNARVRDSPVYQTHTSRYRRRLSVDGTSRETRRCVNIYVCRQPDGWRANIL